MEDKMLEILKKSMAIDKAARKFDKNPIKTDNSRSQKGFIDEVYNHMGGSDFTDTPQMDVTGPQYEEALNRSNLPKEVIEAMKNNPIPRPDMVTNNFNEDQIRELRGGSVVNEGELYNDDDEFDFDTVIKQQPKRGIREQQIQHTNQKGMVVSPELIKKLVNEEIKRILPKILPKVVEHYIQQGLIKENMEVLKKIKPRR